LVKTPESVISLIDVKLHNTSNDVSLLSPEIKENNATPSGNLYARYYLSLARAVIDKNQPTGKLPFQRLANDEYINLNIQHLRHIEHKPPSWFFQEQDDLVTQGLLFCYE